MVKASEIKKVRTENKLVVEMFYELQWTDGAGNEKIRFTFVRNPDNPIRWLMSVMPPDTQNATLYMYHYEMPKQDMSLQMVVAKGMRLFQEAMQQEVFVRSQIEFAIGDKIGDMYG